MSNCPTFKLDADGHTLGFRHVQWPRETAVAVVATVEQYLREPDENDPTRGCAESHRQCARDNLVQFLKDGTVTTVVEDDVRFTRPLDGWFDSVVPEARQLGVDIVLGGLSSSSLVMIGDEVRSRRFVTAQFGAGFFMYACLTERGHRAIIDAPDRRECMTDIDCIVLATQPDELVSMVTCPFFATTTSGVSVRAPTRDASEDGHIIAQTEQRIRAFLERAWRNRE